jgi:hypothetical protein
MLKKALTIGILTLLTGAGCAPVVSRAPANTRTGSSGWTDVREGIARYECVPADCGARLIVFKFDGGAFKARLENAPDPLTVEGWANKLPDAVFVTNGFYFDETGSPTGYFSSEGKRVGIGQFDLSKSALLSLSPALSIVKTAGTETEPSDYPDAAQSYPLLIASGEPADVAESGKEARRSFVGTDADGRTYYFGYVPEDAISLAELAKTLAKLDIPWDDVLNLDGGTSTGFVARGKSSTETMNSIVQVPNVIVIERK